MDYFHSDKSEPCLAMQICLHTSHRRFFKENTRIYFVDGLQTHNYCKNRFGIKEFVDIQRHTIRKRQKTFARNVFINRSTPSKDAKDESLLEVGAIALLVQRLAEKGQHSFFHKLDGEQTLNSLCGLTCRLKCETNYFFSIDRGIIRHTTLS